MTLIALEIDQGDDEVIDLTVWQPGGVNPVDLTDAKLWFYIKAKLEDADADALLRKTTEVDDGITVTDLENGIANVQISHLDTSGFLPKYLGKALPWQLQVLDSLGNITTLARGRITVNADLITATV